MSIAAVVISDRPPDLYLNDCLRNLRDVLPVGLKVHVVDDTAHLLGMAGAVQAGFAWALAEGLDHVVWIEEDFRFAGPLPLQSMMYVLRHKHLAQLVLKRQPWSAEEKAAGGQIQTNPDAYEQCELEGIGWVEHSTLFSLNPCLIPRRTLELGWVPGALGAERAITDTCLRAGLSFAYYGSIEDPPLCEHVGHQRSAGYRW